MVTPARQSWSALVVKLTEGADRLVRALMDQGYEQVEQWSGSDPLRSLGQSFPETAQLDLSHTSVNGTAFFTNAFAHLRCPLIVVSERPERSSPAPHAGAAPTDAVGRGFLLKLRPAADKPDITGNIRVSADMMSLVPLEQSITASTRLAGDQENCDGQLLQALRLQSSLSLTSGIAHDVNNLLTVVSTCAGLLMREPLSAMGMSCVHDIRQAGERASALLRQLAQLCRRQFDPPRTVDLNHLILDLRRLMVRLLGEDIELILDLSRQPCPVTVDPRQMDQILLNLAVNARDAMPRKGTFRVATTSFEVAPANPDGRETKSAGARGQHQALAVRGGPEQPLSPLPEWNRLPLILRPGRYVRITVSDTGCGMSDAVLARIFEPGFTTKNGGDGSGIGLATVEHILNAVGGQIDVASTPERGTTFTIVLPEASGAPLANAF